MEQSAFIYTQISPVAPVDLVSQFRLEYLHNHSLFRKQPLIVQRFIEAQAVILADAVVKGLSQVKFSLPDHVLTHKQNEEPQTNAIPAELRVQVIGGLMDRLVRTDLRTALRSRLLELEQSANVAISTGAILTRHAIVMHMVHNMLPSGKSVQYDAVDGDEIPSIPVKNISMSGSSRSTLTSFSIKDMSHDEVLSGDISAPYVEFASRFYLPQWVSFDDDGSLLVSTINEAEANIASMQNYLAIIHAAIGLAPYIVADEEYQSKRYGILGQLVNQGRALAHYQVREIIRTVQRRSTLHDLDRGLSISLPYFNDQTLRIEELNFDVIPSGKVMFVPAFIVLAVRAQGARIAQDTRLSQSTRRQILIGLSTLEGTFLR